MDEDLLDLAQDLARREAGRPKHASLRRAANAAYYAVFHRLARLCADELVGWSKGWDVVTPVYRSLDHRAARRVFERERGRGTEALAELGEIFLVLQEARLAADYDPQPFAYGRGEVLDLIESARRALRILAGLTAETRLRLAVDLVIRPRQHGST